MYENEKSTPHNTTFCMCDVDRQVDTLILLNQGNNESMGIIIYVNNLDCFNLWECYFIMNFHCRYIALSSKH